MKYLIIAALMLAGCKPKFPSAEDVCETFINSINTGNFQQLDGITGPRFLDERAERCKFIHSGPRGLTITKAPDGACTSPKILKEWDTFVRDLNLHMAPCQYKDLSVRDTVGAATIICGEHKDTFLIMEDEEGWRLNGTAYKNMYNLGQQLIIEKMVALFK